MSEEFVPERCEITINVTLNHSTGAEKEIIVFKNCREEVLIGIRDLPGNFGRELKGIYYIVMLIDDISIRENPHDTGILLKGLDLLCNHFTGVHIIGMEECDEFAAGMGKTGIPVVFATAEMNRVFHDPDTGIAECADKIQGAVRGQVVDYNNFDIPVSLPRYRGKSPFNCGFGIIHRNTDTDQWSSVPGYFHMFSQK
jgi:hypothetical protein